MITFKEQAAQGDVLLTRIESAPEGLTKIEPEDGKHIIAHSETGHHHVMDGAKADFYQSANDDFILYLVVNEETPLIHMRSFDTHAPISVPPGVYEITRQREYIPEGFRRAAD